MHKLFYFSFFLQGCTFHGFTTCFPNDRSTLLHPSTKQSVEELYTVTMKREKELPTRGYKVVTKWEHDFHLDIKRNDNLRTFVNGLDVQERLNPRDSFWGGAQMLSNFITEKNKEKRLNTMTLQVYTHGQTNIVDIR